MRMSSLQPHQCRDAVANYCPRLTRDAVANYCPRLTYRHVKASLCAYVNKSYYVLNTVSHNTTILSMSDKQLHWVQLHVSALGIL